MHLPIDSIVKIYYVILAVVGVPVNLITILILSRGKSGLSVCTTCYLVAMAAADLMVIVTEVILRYINGYYFPIMFFLNITPICSIRAVLGRAATDCSVWFTVNFTFDRFVAICCQKMKTKYCTKKTVFVVLATTGVLLCLKNVPFYFTLQPTEVINNVPWFCRTKQSYFTEPGWIGFDWFDTLLTPLPPFAFILLFNVLTVRHIITTSQVRKGLRGQNRSENDSDPEMENRRKSIILLFCISGSFILLWLTYVIYLLFIITGATLNYYRYSLYTFHQVGSMLQSLSCCTNTFIYGVTQSKFRQQLKTVVKYPVTIIIKLSNKQIN